MAIYNKSGIISEGRFMSTKNSMNRLSAICEKCDKEISTIIDSFGKFDKLFKDMERKIKADPTKALVNDLWNICREVHDLLDKLPSLNGYNFDKYTSDIKNKNKQDENIKVFLKNCSGNYRSISKKKAEEYWNLCCNIEDYIRDNCEKYDNFDEDDFDKISVHTTDTIQQVILKAESIYEITFKVFNQKAPKLNEKTSMTTKEYLKKKKKGLIESNLSESNDEIFISHILSSRNRVERDFYKAIDSLSQIDRIVNKIGLDYKTKKLDKIYRLDVVSDGINQILKRVPVFRRKLFPRQNVVKIFKNLSKLDLIDEYVKNINEYRKFANSYYNKWDKIVTEIRNYLDEENEYFQNEDDNVYTCIEISADTIEDAMEYANAIYVSTYYALGETSPKKYVSHNYEFLIEQSIFESVQFI